MLFFFWVAAAARVIRFKISVRIIFPSVWTDKPGELKKQFVSEVLVWIFLLPGKQHLVVPVSAWTGRRESACNHSGDAETGMGTVPLLCTN